MHPEQITSTTIWALYMRWHKDNLVKNSNILTFEEGSFHATTEYQVSRIWDGNVEDCVEGVKVISKNITSY